MYRRLTPTYVPESIECACLCPEHYAQRDSPDCEKATEKIELMRKKDAEKLQTQTRKVIEESEAAAAAAVDLGTFKVNTKICAYMWMCVKSAVVILEVLSDTSIR